MKKPAPTFPGQPILANRPPALTALEVLAKCGYPIDTLVLDNESYFDETFGLKKMSTIECVMDKRFEDLGWAVKFNNNPSVFQQLGTAELGNLCEDHTIILFNAPYDALVLDRLYGIRPKFIVDVLALARAWNSRRRNDLGTLCKHFKLPEKGRTADFSGVTNRRRIMRTRRGTPSIRPLATAAQLQALAEYACNDADREYDIFNILLPLLSNPETELRLMRHTLDLWLRPTLRLDKEKGKTIIHDMNVEIAKTVQRAGFKREDISANRVYEAELVDALKVAGDNPMHYMKPVKGGKWKFADAKADETLDLLVNHKSERVRQIIMARKAIKSWPLHISRVQSMIDIADADGGNLPIPLKYHAAHTGRMGGTEGINPQNFGSRGHPLISSVRNMIIAPDGQTLVITDAAQIEARICDYLAGQTDSCDRWRRNEDQYSYFASKVLGYRVRKPTKDDPAPISKKLKWARDAIGKIGVLGCQYGMGPYEPNSNKSKPNYFFAAADLSLDMAVSIVDTYRKDRTAVVKFWKDVENAFLFTAKYQRPSSLPRGIRFDHTENCDVVCTLPSGREIHYHNVRIDGKNRLEVFNEMMRSWEGTWGGSLVENIVQAVARDVLLEGMLRLEDQGFHTALSVHDELVMPVPLDRAEACLQASIEELSREPVWAPGIPLGAEGCISDFYRK